MEIGGCNGYLKSDQEINKGMRHLITLVFFIFLSFASFHSEAQPGPLPCGGPGQPPCGPGAPVPITGIEILIGAGALLGAKRMIANRKTNT